jgi:hypothetical protein
VDAPSLWPVFLLAVAIFGVAVAAMAIGVMLSGRCLRGSCGGAGVAGPDGLPVSCADCPNRREAHPVLREVTEHAASAPSREP